MLSEDKIQNGFMFYFVWHLAFAEAILIYKYAPFASERFFFHKKMKIVSSLRVSQLTKRMTFLSKHNRKYNCHTRASHICYENVPLHSLPPVLLRSHALFLLTQIFILYLVIFSKILRLRKSFNRIVS